MLATANKDLGIVPSLLLEAFIGASDVGMKLKLGVSKGQLYHRIKAMA